MRWCHNKVRRLCTSETLTAPSEQRDMHEGRKLHGTPEAARAGDTAVRGPILKQTRGRFYSEGTISLTEVINLGRPLPPPPPPPCLITLGGNDASVTG